MAYKVVRENEWEDEYHLTEDGDITLCGLSMESDYGSNVWIRLDSRHYGYAECVGCHQVHYHPTAPGDHQMVAS